MVSVTVPRSLSRTSPPENSGIMVRRFVQRLAPASVRIAWSFLPISARPPAEVDIGAAQALADIDRGQAGACSRSGLSETSISRSHRRSLDLSDVGTPCSAA